MTKDGQLAFEVQCVSGLADEAKKWHESVLVLEAAARTKVSNCGKSLAMSLT